MIKKRLIIFLSLLVVLLLSCAENGSVNLPSSPLGLGTEAAANNIAVANEFEVRDTAIASAPADSAGYSPGESVTITWNLYAEGAAQTDSFVIIIKNARIDNDVTTYAATSGYGLASTVYELGFDEAARQRVTLFSDNSDVALTGATATIVVPSDQIQGAMRVHIGAVVVRTDTLPTTGFQVITQTGTTLPRIYEFPILLPIIAPDLTATNALHSDCASDTTSAEDVCLIGVYQSANSHAAHCGSAPEELCIEVTDANCDIDCSPSLCSDANAEGVLSLTQSTNSHVTAYDSAAANSVCCKLNTGCAKKLDTCRIDSACLTTELRLAAFYQSDNSHIATIGGAPEGICCELANRDVLTVLDATQVATNNLQIVYNKNFADCAFVKTGATLTTVKLCDPGTGIIVQNIALNAADTQVRLCKETDTSFCSDPFSVS